MSEVGTPEFRRNLDEIIAGLKEFRGPQGIIGPDGPASAFAAGLIAAAERVRGATTETPEVLRDTRTVRDGAQVISRAVQTAAQTQRYLGETIANAKQLKCGSLDAVTERRVDNIIATATRLRGAKTVTAQTQRDLELLVAESDALRRMPPKAKPKSVSAEAKRHADEAKAAAADVKRLRREADAARREYVKFEGDLRVVDHYTGRVRTPSIKDRERSRALLARIDDLEKQAATAVMRTATAARAYSKARYGTVLPKFEQAARAKEREALRALDALRSQPDPTKRGNK